MSCQDDANWIGPVSLFVGADSANWNTGQFATLAEFARSHKVSTLIIKAFQWGGTAGQDHDGLWYGGMSGIDAIYQTVRSKDINVLFYGFLWGDPGNVAGDIRDATAILNKYGNVCLDMEGANWTGNQGASMAAQIGNALKALPGKVWLSYPADFADHNQSGFVQAMSPAVNVFMPMAYSDHLVSCYRSQILAINSQACIQPTLDLSTEFGPNDVASNTRKMMADGCPAISFWYEGFARQNPTLLDQVMPVHIVQGETSMVQTNNQGTVLDIVRSFQLENGESEDLCGPWSVSALRLAGMPGKGARGSAEDVDQWADAEADKYGSHFSWPGSSIQDMYNFLTDATDPQSKQRNMHWWDITPDVNHIRAAIKAGYPVICTANEQNIIEKKSGQRAYPWNLNVNHIIPITGVDHDGDFIVADELNNSFQGYWPPVYLANRLNPSWATVVQVTGPDPHNPWLKPIPSGDPTTWPQGFNAQNFSGGGAQPSVLIQTSPIQKERNTWVSTGQQHQADLTWAIGHKIVPVSFPGQDVPADGSGIKNSWVHEYQNGNNHGYALTPELDYVGWDDKPRKVVWFSDGSRCEWDGQSHWFK